VRKNRNLERNGKLFLGEFWGRVKDAFGRVLES
jgi:hypothetical protein